MLFDEDFKSSNRKVGEFWEDKFCELVLMYGKSYTRLQDVQSGPATAYTGVKEGQQRDRHTLPDIIIWTYPGEYHEIKHKAPENEPHGPSYRLEVYRFNHYLWLAQETQQNVFYTIHNWEKAGGKHIKTNNINHWETINILDLNEKWYACDMRSSYVGTEMLNVETYWWDIGLWQPLKNYWNNNF